MDVFVDHLRTVVSPNQKLTFCLKTLDRRYYLLAPTAEAMRIWIDVLFTGAEGYQEFCWLDFHFFYFIVIGINLFLDLFIYSLFI